MALGAWGLGWTLIRVNLGHDLIADILLEVPPTSDEREREEMLQLDYAIAFALSEEEDYFEDSLARISTMIPVVSTSPLSPMPSPTVHEPVAYPLFAAAEEDHAPYAHVSSSSESARYDLTMGRILGPPVSGCKARGSTGTPSMCLDRVGKAWTWHIELDVPVHCT